MAPDAHDVSNFSSPLAHRMPTVSASQALQGLSNSSAGGRLETGLKTLDKPLDLQRKGLDTQCLQGLLCRGRITEVYGPPGVGKTALGIQVAANTLCNGDRVIWVDCASKLPGCRLKEILSGKASQTVPEQTPRRATPSVEEMLKNLDHYSTPTLCHLLALLIHPEPGFPPRDTSMIIIDSVSTVFTTAFPRTVEESTQAARGHSKATPKEKQKQEAGQWASSRRWAVMGDFVLKLGKLATLNNIGVLLTNQTLTRVRPETGAVLVPAVSSTLWEAGIASRLVLYRDFVRLDRGGGDFSDVLAPNIRFARVLKVGGVVRDAGKPVTFIINRDGLREMDLSLSLSQLHSDVEPTPTPVGSNPGKRKRVEIADSDSNDDEEGVDNTEDFQEWPTTESVETKAETEPEPEHEPEHGEG